MKKIGKKIVLIGLLSLIAIQVTTALGSGYVAPPDPNNENLCVGKVVIQSTPQPNYRGPIGNDVSLTWKFTGAKGLNSPCIVDRFEANIQRYFGMGSAWVIASNSRTSFSWYEFYSYNLVGYGADHSITTSIEIVNINVWYRGSFTMFYHDTNGNYGSFSITSSYIKVDYGIGSGGSVPVLPV
ncbi:MAG: hypothetical protein ACW986_18965 [Promethearchaeota archaeon]|jgi:hypothetical protein